MLVPDTLLQERYLIVKPIGQGGMGAVYQAIDQRLGNMVALKETLAEAEPLRLAFEREARTLANLRHPALPRVSDHFTTPEGQFLVMEFIPGADLGEQLLQQGGALPQAQVLAWADQLLDALDYLHAQEPPIVHRDIKPQNIKLTERNQVILLDFGLAKGGKESASRVTTGGSIFGYTPQYAPLEQIQGQGTDPRSDLYALAATLYHFLTGSAPPDALTRATASITGNPDPLRAATAMNPALSPAVAEVLHRAMAQNPEQRFPSASAMREALREAQAAPQLLPAPSQPKSAPKGAPAPTTRSLPRLWAAIGGAVLVVLLVLLGIGMMTDASGTTPTSTPETEAQEPGTPVAGAPATVTLSQAQLFRTLSPVLAVDVSPDGQTIAAGHQDGLLRLYQASDGSLLRALEGHGSAINSVAFSPDGQTLASGGSDRTVRLWRVSDGRALRTLEGHTGGVLSVAFSPNGQTLASGSIDEEVRLWQVSDGNRLRTLGGHSAAVQAVAFSPDGQTLASGSVDTTIILWNSGSGQALRTLSGHSDVVNAVRFSPDGALLASGAGHRDPTIRLWQVSDGALARTLSGHSERVLALSFDPEGQRLASASLDRSVRLWSIREGALLASGEGHTDGVRGVAFAPSGTQVLSGGADNTIRVWQIQ